MYLPPAFAEKDLDAIFGLMASQGVATVVSSGPDGMIASHVPVEVDRHAGDQGVLRCHFAKPNPQSVLIADGSETLFIFQGPQAYVTPSWYATKAENGKVVPTLNYAVVHAYGVGRTIDDPAAMRRHLGTLTDRFESGFQDPWAISDAPDDFIDRLMKGITVVEVTLTRLEGKWKMSQNRPNADRLGVAAGLREQGRDDAARLVEQYGLGGVSGGGKG